VNRRLAAHKNRKGQSSAPETEHPAHDEGDSRAAQAAARVAARYAKAPSYSQMQAEEARVAVRAAEIATKVALEAQAVAETALAGLHAATQPSRGPAVVQPISPPPLPRPEVAPFLPDSEDREAGGGEDLPDKKDSASEGQERAIERRVFDIRWDPDLPMRPAERTSSQRRVQEEFELSVEDWWSPAEFGENLRSNPIEIRDDEAPQANLIQFPRELVATRRLRPRLAEVATGEADADGQLSIFEVDPGGISTEAAVPAAPQGEGSTSSWTDMRLDSHPVGGVSSAREAVSAPSFLPVASMGLRLMAAAVDGSLILASFVGAGFLAANSFQHPPVGKPAELLGIAGLVAVGLLYYGFFFSLPACTPGMRYAGIGLCTFDSQTPTRAQLRRRLLAMLLSLLPVGLGLVWSLFDEDHLSAHDRFSQTYLRRL